MRHRPVLRSERSTRDHQLWSIDFCESHPDCPERTTFLDDGVRESNSLPAVLAALKDLGEADCRMAGEAALPLSVVGFTL